MPEYIDLSYDDIVKETDEAKLVDFGERLVWIPKSVIDEFNDDSKTMGVANWFAYQEELEDYAI